MRQRQRVAAGDDDVADLGVVADVLDHPLVVAADARPSRRGPCVARLRVQKRQYIVQTWRGDAAARGRGSGASGPGRASPCPLRAGRPARSPRGSPLPAARAPTGAGSGRAGSSGSMREK